MKQRVFGYDKVGWVNREQVNTTRAMSGGMKTFLDSEVLEGKIPDKFSAAKGGMMQAAKKELGK